ncbi:MAG TPA: hypothetical protein VMS88_03375, partial [Terriglobales bacterium]|nr:hypothetical protein [Terriglobales bacterium]
AYAALQAPATSIRAAEAWLRAGEPDSARAALARIGSRAALPPALAQAAATLERLAATLDSLQRARAAEPHGAR